MHGSKQEKKAVFYMASIVKRKNAILWFLGKKELSLSSACGGKYPHIAGAEKAENKNQHPQGIPSEDSCRNAYQTA